MLPTAHLGQMTSQIVFLMYFLPTPTIGYFLIGSPTALSLNVPIARLIPMDITANPFGTASSMTGTPKVLTMVLPTSTTFMFISMGIPFPTFGYVVTGNPTHLSGFA